MYTQPGEGGSASRPFEPDLPFESFPFSQPDLPFTQSRLRELERHGM